MNLEMIPVEIVGLKTDLQATIHTLQRLGCIQVDERDYFPAATARPLTLDGETLRAREEFKSLAARVEGFLDTLGDHHPSPKPALKASDRPTDCLTEVRAGVAELTPQVQSILSRRERLKAELDALPRYEATLRKLLPILPPSACDPGNVCVGVLASRAHVTVLDLIGKHVLEQTGGRADVRTGDVDDSTRAMLLVFPQEFTGEVEALLGREDVSRLRLPTDLEQGSPEIALAALHRRLVDISEQTKATDHELADLASQWYGKLAVCRAALHDQLEAVNVLSLFGETEMTFVLMGWVPARDVEKVELALQETVGETVLMRQLPLTPEMRERAPTVLQNPRPARPFESLVRLRSLPRYGDIDPTQLLAIFMPLFFGMMLGDVAYGALLLVLSLAMLRKSGAGVMRDILIVLAMGAGWAIFFGFLFGEAFGTLGEDWGMHPIWFERASPEHVGGLLLMTLGVGAVHITLGLFLGLWEAVKEKSRSHLLERGGMLLGLMGLFLMIGALTDFLPQGLITPAVGGLILGIVLLSIPLGWVGILLGPVEFIGLIGNVLSYLRIAAIGLASIYLAQVANDMAGQVGNLVLGAIVAVLIHALNLVMGAFSPTIHSLRLHYVEFFRKFYQGGGRLYEPFKSQLEPDVH